MNNMPKKFIAALVALTLVFAMFTGMTVSALPTEDTISAFGQEWEILEDEIYGAYESLSECVEDYEPEDCEEIDMDDSVWSFQLEVGQDWWYASTYFYTHDGPVKDNFATITPQPFANYAKPGDEKYEEVVAKRMQNYASSVALDKVGERLALTLRGPWTACNGQAKFIFRAPKSGYVVLFNEGLIQGATKDSVFSSFSDPKGSGYVELTIKKNDVAISEVVKISCDSMTAEFPKAGTTGRFKVTEGDEIEVHLRAYDQTWENNTVFVDPVVAYTEVIEEPKNDVDTPVDDTTNSNDKNNSSDDKNKNDSDSEDEKEETGFVSKIFTGDAGWLVYVIIGVVVIAVAAGVVTVILVTKKKKTDKPE